ncbi:hypothetical protein GCM10027416_10080 [Okibacterium endophyticum]
MPALDTNQAVAELTKRIERLESATEIARLQQEYIRNLAARDWDAVASAYTDDAICDIRHHGVHVGREAVRAMFAAELENVVLAKDGYILSSPDITVSEDGETAEGVWTWHRLQADFRTSWGLMRVWGPWSEGKYVTQYRRVGGEWKISKLWFRVHAPDDDGEFVAAGREGRVLGGAK